MPFVYEPITPADRERMESLNIMIGWKKPNARHWTVNRETGDFLVWIAPDWEPPHWTWYGFWWRERLFRVELNTSKTHPDTGYCLEIAGIAAEDGKSIPPQDKEDFGKALFEAVKVEATAAVSRLFAGIHQKKQLPPDSTGPIPIDMKCTLNDLSTSPFATFQIDFPRSIR